MRWYWVPCLSASRLKNSTLRLERAIVIFTPSSRSIRSSGLGRKSGTTFSFPKGSFVYLIFALINSFALSPVASSKYPDHVITVCEADRHYTFTYHPKAVVSLFHRAVRLVFGEAPLRGGEGDLSLREANAMFALILLILLRVPVKLRGSHYAMLPLFRPGHHTWVWLPIWRPLRGRNRPYGRPPAQTPACSFSAPGSSVVLASALQGVPFMRSPSAACSRCA